MASWFPAPRDGPAWRRSSWKANWISRPCARTRSIACRPTRGRSFFVSARSSRPRPRSSTRRTSSSSRGTTRRSPPTRFISIGRTAEPLFDSTGRCLTPFKPGRSAYEETMSRKTQRPRYARPEPVVPRAFDELSRIATRVESEIAAGPIVPAVSPAEIRQYLASRYDFGAPRTLDEVCSDVETLLRQWQVHVTHPRYFGLF